MGTYPLEVLISKWGRGEVTVEQVIGQILLLLEKLEKRLKAVETREIVPPPRPTAPRKRKPRRRPS